MQHQKRLHAEQQGLRRVVALLDARAVVLAQRSEQQQLEEVVAVSHAHEQRHRADEDALRLM